MSFAFAIDPAFSFSSASFSFCFLTLADTFAFNPAIRSAILVSGFDITPCWGVFDINVFAALDDRRRNAAACFDNTLRSDVTFTFSSDSVKSEKSEENFDIFSIKSKSVP
jgi:hypothetical protein